MGHLQRLASLDEDPVLSSDPGAHHHGCRGRQPQRARAGDGQDCDGRLEGKADDDLRVGDVRVVALRGGERVIRLKYLNFYFENECKHLCVHLPGSSPLLCQSRRSQFRARPPE